ncbi:MAG: ester cyclase [Dermatophilaceae bacterium]
MGAAREHIEHFLDLWNNGDFDKVQTGMADDQVWVSPLWAQLTGSEAILNRYRADRTAFPDRRIDVSKWVEEGDTVVAEYEWSGTHTGPLLLADGSELAPTGQHTTLMGVEVFEVRDGKTVTQHSYFDQLPAMMQAGVVAPTQQP